MKLTLLVSALFIGSITLLKTKKQKVAISITKTFPYCGGANPPQEIIDESQKMRIPFKENFYVIKGAVNLSGRKIIATLTFDSTGKKSIYLTPGTYSIIDDFGFKQLKVNAEQFDVSCMEQKWKKPIYVFEVKKGENLMVSQNISELCPHQLPCSKTKRALPQ